MVSRVDPLRLIHPISGFRFMERSAFCDEAISNFLAKKNEIASSFHSSQ